MGKGSITLWNLSSGSSTVLLMECWGRNVPVSRCGLGEEQLLHHQAWDLLKLHRSYVNES